MALSVKPVFIHVRATYVSIVTVVSISLHRLTMLLQHTQQRDIPLLRSLRQKRYSTQTASREADPDH